MMWTQRLTSFFGTSLQRKLMLVITILVSLVMTAFGLYLINSQNQTASAELEGRAARTANLLSQSTALLLWNVDKDGINAQLTATMADPEVNTVSIYETGASEPLVTTNRGEKPAVDPITYKAEIIFQNGADKVSLGTVQVVYSRELLNRSLGQTQILIGVIDLALVLLLVTSIYFLIGRLVINPLNEMTSFTSHIAAGDLSGRVNLTSRDEMSILASSLNSMTAQLRDFIATLEQRVADRTKALATSTEISHRLSTILNQKELVSEVVDQVNNVFGYYHTQIYFYDEAGENLVMAGGTGVAGELLLAQFHKVAKGRGLVGRAAKSNEPVLVSDTAQSPEWLPNPLLPNTKAEIAIPISIGDRVLGVLDVQHNIKDGLKREDVDSLQSIANQVAVALQNIQSTESVAKRATELQTVARISTAASTISDVQKMLESVVHLTQRGFGLYHAHIFIYNENTAELAITACGYKEGDEHEGTHGTAIIPIAQEQSLVARAGRTRQAVIVNNVQNEPGWLPNPLLPDTASELAVPLIVGDQLLGVLDVQSERVNAFTEEDANIQTTLASQVAVALQNARSFKQTQKQAERETAVNLITQKIQNTISIESALQIAARELGHALGMKSTQVTLDPEALVGDHKPIGNKQAR